MDRSTISQPIRFIPSACFCEKYNIICIVNLYYYNVSYYIPKTKKFGCVGRGDLTFLFKSCEIYESQGIVI